MKKSSKRSIKEDTVLESMVKWLRSHRKNGLTLRGENRGKIFYAGIRGKEIRVQVYPSDSEERSYPDLDYVVAL